MQSKIPLPRKTRRRIEIEGARFLTFSCMRRFALFGNDAIKQAFIEHLAESRQRTRFKLIAYVVMPEHVHLIIVPALAEFPMPRVLRDLKGGFANNVLRRWRTLEAPILKRIVDASGKERFWQPGGGYDRNVELHGEFYEKVDYIHDNPRRRGLVAEATDWPFSSARWYAGDLEKSLIAIDATE